MVLWNVYKWWPFEIRSSRWGSNRQKKIPQDWLDTKRKISESTLLILSLIFLKIYTKFLILINLKLVESTLMHLWESYGFLKKWLLNIFNNLSSSNWLCRQWSAWFKINALISSIVFTCWTFKNLIHLPSQGLRHFIVIFSVQVCERLLMELFCECESSPFHDPVSKAVSSELS